MDIILRKNNGVRTLVPVYRPWSLLEEIDDLAREVWDSWEPFTFEPRLIPRTQIYEEKDHLAMKTELPGFEAKDLEITLKGDKLTIKAEKKEENSQHTRESYYGQFLHKVVLPYPVNEGNITATFENGVLELKLPKAEEVEAKKIEIKAQFPETKNRKQPRKSKQQKS